MTTAEIALHSRAIREKADALFARRKTWARGSARVNGALVGVVLFTSSRKPKRPSEPHAVWITRCDGAGCSCPAAQKSASGRCCHRLAVARDAEQARNQPRRGYSDLFPASDDALCDAF